MTVVRSVEARTGKETRGTGCLVDHLFEALAQLRDVGTVSVNQQDIVVSPCASNGVCPCATIEKLGAFFLIAPPYSGEGLRRSDQVVESVCKGVVFVMYQCVG